MERLLAVDSSLSMFNKQSTVSRINSGESLQTDSLLEMVFQFSRSISEATNGAFDVTVAPLVNAWGFGFKHDQWPDTATVDSLRQLVGWQKVSIHNHQLQKADPRMVLDFGAVAKGFGVDEVASLFRSKGIKNFMIEIGGEIVSSGQNPKGAPWRIGINKPDDDPNNLSSEMQDIIELNDCAIATSGNYRNFYMHEGRRVAHHRPSQRFSRAAQHTEQYCDGSHMCYGRRICHGIHGDGTGQRTGGAGEASRTAGLFHPLHSRREV